MSFPVNFFRSVYLTKNVFKPHHVSRRTFLYSWKKGFNRDTIIWLQQPIDLSVASVRAWVARKEFDALRDSHRIRISDLNKLGPDLAAAHFVLSHKGAVKFCGLDRWFKVDKEGKINLPLSLTNKHLEAIDATNTTMMYESFDNLENLNHLKYLNLSHCKHIDDWCLDRLVQFRNSLQVLDLSSCPNISERGLACLHKMSHLKKIILKSADQMKHAKLTALMLEEALPCCYIDGIDYTDLDSNAKEKDEPQSISFMESWEKKAMAEQMEVIAVLMRDHGLLDENKVKKDDKT